MLKSHFRQPMESAARLIPKLKAKAPLTRAELAVAAWPAAVGRRLAGRTKALAFIRERLVVEVEDALWQRNLQALSAQILDNFNRTLGADAPRELEFRVGVPRRPPQRAASSAGDEAAAIADSVLRRIYIASRAKAGA